MPEIHNDRLLAALPGPITPRQAELYCALAHTIAERPEWADMVTLGQALRAEQLDPLEWMLDARQRHGARSRAGDTDDKAMHVLTMTCRALTDVGRAAPVEPVLVGMAVWTLYLVSLLPRLEDISDPSGEPALWWRVERNVLVISSATRSVLRLHLFWPRLPVEDLEALRLLIYRLVVAIIDARPQQEIGLA